MLSSYIICTLATVPSLAVKSLKGVSTVILSILDGAIILSALLAAIAFVLLIFLAIIDLLYVSNFVLTASKNKTLALSYQSAYERFIDYMMEQGSKYLDR